MRQFKTLIILLVFLVCANSLCAYNRADSIRVVQLLKEANTLKTKPRSWMLWFGKKFLGTPYVGGTLDNSDKEKLIVNTRQLDCTTYVEIVTALTLCAQHKEKTFGQFCERLRHVRYIDGKVEYTKRQHYFTVWIDDNVKEYIVKDVHPNPPFSALQTVQVNWMSTHASNYKMLKNHPSWMKGIKKMEQSVSGKQYRYIPKKNIANTKLFRQTIHDGDIIVIITNKRGLDTTHIGLASWHSDGLHLLNASSIHHQVVDEPMTLYEYMQKHPVQIGIRVCRVVGE